jgi:carbamoyl-phosphate synthase large subunit
MVINTPRGRGARTDGWEIRRAAVERGIPCITTMTGASAAARAIGAKGTSGPSVRSLQELHRRPTGRRAATPDAPSAVESGAA